MLPMLKLLCRPADMAGMGITQQVADYYRSGDFEASPDDIIDPTCTVFLIWVSIYLEVYEIRL